MESLIEIQKQIKTMGADAWILVDYENKNPALVSLLGDKMLTRKIFLVIPSSYRPYIICHSIDTTFLKDPAIKKDYDLKVYKSWGEMLELEKKEFKNYSTVLMDVSDKGLLPRVSLADYGSVAFIKELGIKVTSSADLLQRLTAVISPRAHALQLQADKLTLQIKDEAFKEIKRLILKDGETDEYTIQQFICDRFHQEGMVYDDPAIVAIGPNANNPHYGPTKEVHSPIKKGDLVLIDMWAKMDDVDGVYADITWMGYVGMEVPEIYAKRFSILKKTIDNCVAFLEKNLPIRQVEGYEVDDVARESITKEGYGEYFVHRVGHNISADVSPHGPGVNMDNYESHDFRSIIDHICFSLEPGIYAPDFGERSETNVYIENRRPIVVAARQDKIIPILSL
jgi:Xaa-Pro aminopeptidase